MNVYSYNPELKKFEKEIFETLYFYDHGIFDIMNILDITINSIHFLVDEKQESFKFSEYDLS
jgi:hypothetical protein